MCVSKSKQCRSPKLSLTKMSAGTGLTKEIRRQANCVVTAINFGAQTVYVCDNRLRMRIFKNSLLKLNE